MIKNVIFDWSGVINDNVYKGNLTVTAVLLRFGIERMPFEQYRQEFELPFMNFYNRYVPKLTFDKEVRIYNEEYAKTPPSKAYPGIVELIKKFKSKRIALGVLSSDSDEHLLVEMERYKLNNVFNYIMIGIHDKEEGLRLMVKENNLDCGGSLFVGDMLHEIEAGKKVGFKTAGVTWGVHTENKLKSVKPDFIFHNLYELEKAVIGEYEVLGMDREKLEKVQKVLNL